MPSSSRRRECEKSRKRGILCSTIVEGIYCLHMSCVGLKRKRDDSSLEMMMSAFERMEKSAWEREENMRKLELEAEERRMKLEFDAEEKRSREHQRQDERILSRFTSFLQDILVDNGHSLYATWPGYPSPQLPYQSNTSPSHEQAYTHYYYSSQQDDDTTSTSP